MVRRPLLAACLLAALLSCLPAAALGGGKGLTASGDELRALFVQRLVGYVTWPEGAGPGPGQPVIIAATDPSALRPYFPDDGDGPRFVVRQWPTDHCHVLVLNGVPAREAAAILKRTMGLPVLSIGENPANLRLGAIVNFYMANDRLRLQVSPEAARRAGLGISSRLLKISSIYRGEDE